MDLNAIKAKLGEMQTQNTNSGNGGGKNLFYKPTIGKEQIRVVPNKYNKSFPFTEMKFYYGIGNIRVIASPANWGEKDPIMEFTKQLRSTNESENWKLAKKLDPKTRVFLPIVVRGKEDEGVKLWQFGKEVYQSFLNMAADEEIGDFTDILQGRDIKLTTVGPEVTGTKFNKTTISPSMKISSLSDDENVVKSMLENQADPKKITKQLSYDEIKSELQSWLSPEDSEGEISSEPPVAFDNNEPAKSNYSTSNVAPKKSKSAQFDDIFKDDDLPF